MPIERDAFYSMLGIAKRAGVLTLGTDGVLTAIASGSAKLVLLDAAASDNTKKKFHDSCAFYGVDLYETVPDNQLSLAIGKEGQNARLAARLTGWKIDIKSQSQIDEQVLAGEAEALTDEEA